MFWSSRRGGAIRRVWAASAASATTSMLLKRRRVWHGPRSIGGTNMRAIIALMVLASLGRGAQAAETVRIGLLHTLSPAPLYLAMARGYFAQEGLDAQFKFFEAAQPIAAAAVSGDIDVGITALTGGFFNLAGRGALKVIGGGLHEERGFEGTALLASVAAFRRRPDVAGQACRA